MKWAIIIALSLFIGCKPETNAPPVERSEGVSDQPFGIAQWDFVNSDGEGKPVVKGLLSLPSPMNPGVRFSGSWQSRYVGKIGEENKIGPQINGGRLTGEMDKDGQLRLQLNPNMNDNNVTITASVTADSMKGKWQYSNFTGVAASGSFEAVPAK